jgi:hypothetical protein
MPQQLPDIPKVDRKTSYQGLKGIVAKLRDEFIRSYLVDSASVTVVDNPGKTRSAEVNFPNQGGGIVPANAYRAGETELGSDDPENPVAPPALPLPSTDTGIRGTQPLDIASNETDGYTLRVITRRYIYNSGAGTFDEIAFARDVTWDSSGLFYKFGPEIVVETGNVTGSGSASGGLP